MRNMTWFVMIVLVLSASLIIASCAVMGDGSTASQENDPETPVDNGVVGASAHWVAIDRLVWDSGPQTATREIRYSHQADIRVDHDAVTGGNVIAVGEHAYLDDERVERMRHIAGRPVFSVNADQETVRRAVKGQLVAIAYDENGRPLTATRVQMPHVIDDLYAYDGLLGPRYDGQHITVSLWAPTAQNVTLNLYNREKERIETLHADHLSPDNHDKADVPLDGVWRFSGEKSNLDRMLYRFEVTVYHHENNQVNTFDVTDPYSVSLSTDSKYSQLVDLSGDESLMPDGWGSLKKSLPNKTDISLYEIHMRDFSIFDSSVPEAHRGTYLAFTHNGREDRSLSRGMTHLQRLSNAGLTHVHLLPINDIATVNEDPADRVDLHHPYERICDFIDHPEIAERCNEYGATPIREVFEKLAEQDPATEEIQKPYYLPGRMEGLASYDGFNWGYDPLHFNVPEGSYATDPDGPARIMEVREMVRALNQVGLHIVVDVVYNHTFASGLSPQSVLDKVVPGYYHRYHPDTGEMETSTCCDNTAAEHAMMEKLIIDSVLLWAREYKIDAFRFDLMGHHPRYVMENLKLALAELTLEEDGVDGDNIYVYGEGWNFGEVADDRIFEQATQFNMGGTGIGNFNDRIRDAIRGGNVTDNRRAQGFASGLYLFPNEEANPDQQQNLGILLEAADLIRVGMAGNLATYPYVNRHGERVDGATGMIGFALRPEESVNYIDKHDNETLWDNTQVKLPVDMTMDERVRVHLLSNAFINYGQGVPFYQMGTDILRSKSLDRNSFDSGDWYNAVDFSLQTHNWGIGLPPGWDNSERWDLMREFLRMSGLNVEQHHMELAHRIFLDQLKVRYSSPLFRLGTAADIHRRLVFHNTGPDQEPGIIAMSIADGPCAGDHLDEDLDGVLILFNADREEREFTLPQTFPGLERAVLHPVLRDGYDSVVKEAAVTEGHFYLPPLTAVVFIVPVQDQQGEFPCNDL
ncbi:pullulanase-type alpha-1,6-glucosidase [Balneolales bacterium ANBcel1]|nr:pullulanase-type alpha-1,6-glucosidase [Balneolales bacterium ANBcel1]